METKEYNTGLWSKLEEKTLTDNADKDITEIEKLINRPRKAIRDKAFRMELKLTGKGGDHGRKISPAARVLVEQLLTEGKTAGYAARTTGVSYGCCYRIKKEMDARNSTAMTSTQINSALNAVFG